MRITIAIIGFICSVGAFAQEGKLLLTHIKDLEYCLDSSEFHIGEFYYGQSKEAVIIKLNNPDSIKYWNNYTETHYYDGVIFRYDNNGKVYRISAQSPQYSTPNGIITGLSRDEVFDILGLKPMEIPSVKYFNEFKDCSSNISFFIHYDTSLIIVMYEIGIYTQ